MMSDIGNLGRPRGSSATLVRPRWQRIVFAALPVLLVVIVLCKALAGLLTDYWWFQSIDFSGVWTSQVGTKIMLFIVFAALTFLLVYANLKAVALLAPAASRRRRADTLSRYSEELRARRRLIRTVVPLVFALFVGLDAAARWRDWLLFRFGQSFGTSDPLNDVDPSFYMFKLPFIDYTLSWLVGLLVLVTTIVLILYVMEGTIGVSGTTLKVSSRVKIHISILLGAIALLQAGSYFLERFRLTTSRRGFVDGALYTDINAAIPASTLLMLVALLSAVLLVVNLRKKGWKLPAAVFSMWIVVSIVAGSLYPYAVERFSVSPNTSEKEAEFIGHNIEATRVALGLDNVTEEDFDYESTISSPEIEENQSTIENIRLLDPSIVDKTYSALEAKFGYYTFNDLDVDRYQIDDTTTQVLLATRELDSSQIPRKNWEAEHLAYTHGYGAVIAPANAVNNEGEPNFIVNNIPWKKVGDRDFESELRTPQIYFGEEAAGKATDYAIVKTNVEEISGGTTAPDYTGNGGVSIASMFRKVAFGIRFGQIDPIITNNVTSESRVFYIRDIRERVSQLAPFVQWDADPYPVLVDGGISYVLDGYTISDSYPYAQRALTEELSAKSDLRGKDFNYIRNSVKAVVNAYDGSVSLYLSDTLYGDEDPIIRSYQAAFPTLFQEISEMDEAVMDHLRYPEDLFRIQTTMWGRYHIDDAQGFYKQNDGWDVAQKPPINVSEKATNEAVSATERIDPYYLLTQLPNDTEDSFLIFRPFVPHSDFGSESPKKQLTSFMVGRSDPENYGKVSVYNMTKVVDGGGRESNRSVNGPLIVHDKIVSDTRSGTSQEITQLNVAGGGSDVQFGNMLIVPIEQGLLYVRPLYVKGGDNSSAPPRLRNVIVSMGDNVVIGETLDESLRKLFPDATFETLEEQVPVTPDPEDPNNPGDPAVSPTESASVAELLSEAGELFATADQALREGGAGAFSTYQENIALAEEKVTEAAKLLDNE